MKPAPRTPPLPPRKVETKDTMVPEPKNPPSWKTGSASHADWQNWYTQSQSAAAAQYAQQYIEDASTNANKMFWTDVKGKIHCYNRVSWENIFCK